MPEAPKNLLSNPPVMDRSIVIDGDEALKKVIKNLRQYHDVTSLTVKNCPISGTAVSRIKRACPNLRMLTFKTCLSLRWINLSGCKNLETVKVKGCQSLKNICLFHCEKLNTLNLEDGRMLGVQFFRCQSFKENSLKMTTNLNHNGKEWIEFQIRLWQWIEALYDKIVASWRVKRVQGLSENLEGVAL